MWEPVRCAVVTTGSRGDAAVRVLPSQLSRAAAMASCKGASDARAGIARQTTHTCEAGGPIQMGRAAGTEFRFEKCLLRFTVPVAVVGGRIQKKALVKKLQKT